MAEDEKTSGFSPSKLLGAVGGFLSGVGAIAGLFAAKPELVTVVIPPERLVQVVERVEPTALPRQAAPVDAAPSSPQPPPQAPPPAQAALPAQALQGDLEAAIVSIADTPDAFLANMRLINKSQSEALFAGRQGGIGIGGDFQLTDLVGGSCPWRIANANYTLGSLGLTPMEAQMNPSFVSHFKVVPPKQAVIVTLKFNKDMCDNVPSGDSPANLSGTLVIAEGDALRQASVSFEGVPVAKGQ